MRPTKPLIPLQAVAAALRKSMPEPVLARIGQKRTMLMILTTCVQQHGCFAYDLENRREVTQAVMLLQAVAAALGRSRPGPVLARTGQKRLMLMTLTTCIQHHGYTYDLEDHEGSDAEDKTKDAVMLLQAVNAALGKSMPEPVLARIGQKRTLSMILTTCAQQHGFCAAKMESSLS